MSMSSRQVLLNACVTVVCAVLFLTYAELIAPGLIPAGTARVAATVVVLLILGFFAGFSVLGNLSVKLAFLIIVPIAHWLYSGGDAAKPYLAYLIGAVEILCLWIGATVGHFSRRRKAPAPHLPSE